MAPEPIFRPVAELHAHARELVAALRNNHVPIIVTDEGQSSAVLLDIGTYESMQRRLDVLEGIARGERAVAEGRLVSDAEARKRFAKWLDPR